MAIVDDFGAIAKRLRELSSATQGRAKIPDPAGAEWRDEALEVARGYVQSRRKAAGGIGPSLRKHPQPTD